MKDTDLPKPLHWSLPTDGLDPELRNFAVLAELLTVSKLPSTPMLGMDADRADEGEIIVHGPNVMQGYWNNEKATKEVIVEPGVFRTGDLGKLSADGFLSITGRVKSQFKLENGKYVSPAPLEENLKLSPLVEQAVLDGRNMLRTFLIVHPNMHALKPALTRCWCRCLR